MFGRIPSNLLDIYVRYKQDTRAIITWLVSHDRSTYARPQALSIQDLFCLAGIVRAKAVEMPENIGFHFREAIAARTQLTNFFRKDGVDGIEDQETVNHEYFTKSLSKIYTDLCKCCHQSREHCKRQCNRSIRALDDDATATNPFTILYTSTLEKDCPPENEEQHPTFGKGGNGAGNDNPTLSRGDDSPLMDDELSKVIELSKDLQEMDDLLSLTKNIWEKVGKDQTSVVVAASVTNAALAIFETIENQLRTKFNTTNPESLRTKYSQVAQCSGLAAKAGDQCSSTMQHMLEALNISWAQLLVLHQEGPQQVIEDAEAAGRQSSLVLRNSAGSLHCDAQCLAFMLRNIAQLLVPKSSSSKCELICRSSPVYPEVGFLLTHDEKDSNGLRCCYGLQLLLESYKSCLFVPETTHLPSTGRLRTLRFAQEAMGSTKAVLDDPTMPCRCHGTLAYHIENMNSDLDAFIHCSMFDFYFQAPWTCGCHALEMLDALSYYGLRLFSYRNYLGSVVHTYNVLRTLTCLESIPLLDGLSEAFGDLLFPSGRPRRNFKACWVRYMGARLRFKSHSSDHKSGCYAMVIPAHTAKATAGFGSKKESKDPRFEYRKISMLHHIREKGYHLDDFALDRISRFDERESDKSNISTKFAKPVLSHRRRESQYPPYDHFQRLQCLQRALHDELDGPFPIARINLFKVYLDCVRVVSIVSDKWHGDQVRPGQNCLCFVDTLLTAADRCKDNEYRLQPLGCKELVGICQDAIKATLGGKGLDQYLWEHV